MHPAVKRRIMTDDPGKPTPKRQPPTRPHCNWGYAYETRGFGRSKNIWTPNTAWFKSPRQRDQAAKDFQKKYGPGKQYEWMRYIGPVEK